MGIGAWGTHVVQIPYTRNHYTAKQMAEAFSVNVKVVYWLAREGRIPSRKLTPRRLRFPRAAVQAMLKAGYNIKIA